MEAYICLTCGVQHTPSDSAPERCEICLDERQYIPAQGQRWTTLDELRTNGHHSVIRELEPQLTGIGVEPKVAIGQRAVLLQTEAGNFLWDCFGFVDETAIAAVRDRGGLKGIAMSHPHFYGVCVEWSRAFGGVPIYIPEADRRWVMRPDPSISTWQGTVSPLAGVSLIQCGGHFEGSAVLHWRAGAGGRGVLLTGDSITVVAARRLVTFMRSYPNQIPLPASMVRGIVSAVGQYPYDRIYGGWWESTVDHDARAAVERSADRYLAWIEGTARRD
jgi:hypothetical protein